MYKGWSLFLLVIALLAICPATSWAATIEDIDYVKQNSHKLHNKTVTVRGTVSNSVVVDDEFGDIRGAFDLTDATGTIHVRTPKAAPPQGTKKYVVTGVVDSSEDTVQLTQKPGLPVDPKLLAALVGLLAIAAVLVALIARKPQSVPDLDNDRGYPPPPPPPLLPGKICPQCNFSNEADARFCQECRTPLSGGTIATKPKRKDTVVIEPAVADLRVIEGEGSLNGQTFALRNTGKFTLGRDLTGENTISLVDQTVSSEHATIWWMEGKKAFFIQDLGSSNGTLVNGKEVVREELKDNDKVKMGNTVLLFRMVKPNGG